MLKSNLRSTDEACAGRYRALAANEIPVDRKRFLPHITLIRKASRDAAGIPITPETMTVRTISLMSSKRGRNGMIYTEVGTIEAKENPVQMPVEL